MDLFATSIRNIKRPLDRSKYLMSLALLLRRSAAAGPPAPSAPPTAPPAPAWAFSLGGASRAGTAAATQRRVTASLGTCLPAACNQARPKPQKSVDLGHQPLLNAHLGGPRTPGFRAQRRRTPLTAIRCGYRPPGSRTHNALYSPRSRTGRHAGIGLAEPTLIRCARHAPSQTARTVCPARWINT
jgi:hypothetical protein